LKKVEIRSIPVGSGAPLALIAGPCVIESEDLVLRTAENLCKITSGLGIPFIFKSSYDKANRTSVESFRGPGLEEGLRILEKVRSELGVAILSDVHSPEEALSAGEVLDCIQIPAFLCRQTDLLVAAGRTGKPVNIKKGQFQAPEDMRSAALKVESVAGSGGVTLTERGTTFGYHYLVVDFQGLPAMAELGYPVVFDATHSVQYPGGGCGVSSGNSSRVPALVRAAVAVGIDALFIETHPDPSKARCDGPNSVPLDQVEGLLLSALAIDEARRSVR
jgi:2-dehydro-3-deoxyphosphooctonate aldolase (KDO 8-P synthase)